MRDSLSAKGSCGIGEWMYSFCEKIFPICRSITGEGVRETLRILQREIADIDIAISEVASGTQVFDWTVPKEWNIRDSYIITPSGEKICE